ncbi:hypothetical protein AAVH_29193 [Aphelenchoides avenae]|nr:hypothetical protein AAVH_29193 [Aphelenchus avenae]
MLRFPNESLTEIVAYLRRFDLDVVELTSQQFREALSALFIKPKRRLDVVALTNSGVLIKANGMRQSFSVDALRVSLDEFRRLTKDAVSIELRIQFVTRESVILMALRAFLSDHLTLTLRMSYADVSESGVDVILPVADTVVPGGSVFIEKVCMRSAGAREFMRCLADKGLRSLSAAKTGKLCDFDAGFSDRSVAELDMSGFETYRMTRPTFLESVAAYEFKTLGLNLAFMRDSTGLQISYRKTEK